MADNDRTDTAFNPWRLAGMGTELLGSIIGPGLIGWLIDRWAGAFPIWTIVLTTVGVIGGGYNFIRQSMALNREAASAYRRAHAARPEPPREPGRSTAADAMFDRTGPLEPPEGIRFPEDEEEKRLGLHPHPEERFPEDGGHR